MNGDAMNASIPSFAGVSSSGSDAAAAAQSKSLLSRIGSSVWKALERVGQSRARPELLAFAARCEALQPEFAKELRDFASRTK